MTRAPTAGVPEWVPARWFGRANRAKALLRAAPQFVGVLAAVAVLAACTSEAVPPTQPTQTTQVPALPSDDQVGELYVDVIRRICDSAPCSDGPLLVKGNGVGEHVLLDVAASDSRVTIVEIDAAVFDDEGQVIDGGLSLWLEEVRSPRPGVVAIDSFWSASLGFGLGQTHLFRWDGGAWTSTEAADVGMTTTTAVP